MELNAVKNFIEKLNQEEIIFDSHFYKRSEDRPINEGMIRKFLSQLNKLEKVELGKGKKQV